MSFRYLNNKMEVVWHNDVFIYFHIEFVLSFRNPCVNDLILYRRNDTQVVPYVFQLK